jgi:hypothetical protein
MRELTMQEADTVVGGLWAEIFRLLAEFCEYMGW